MRSRYIEHAVASRSRSSGRATVRSRRRSGLRGMCRRYGMPRRARASESAKGLRMLCLNALGPPKAAKEFVALFAADEWPRVKDESFRIETKLVDGSQHVVQLSAYVHGLVVEDHADDIEAGVAVWIEETSRLIYKYTQFSYVISHVHCSFNRAAEISFRHSRGDLPPHPGGSGLSTLADTYITKFSSAA